MIAIPLYQSRVAPVLDWCSTILLIPKSAEKPWHDAERFTVETNVFELLRLLHSRKVSHVICGALSPHALRYGQYLGLQFICGISGAIEEVIEAYRTGQLDLPRFRLPGCRCTGRLRPSAGSSAARYHSEHVAAMTVPGNRGKGGPMRRQQGRGRGRSRIGRSQESVTAVEDTADVYICPQCGCEVSQSRGAPCPHPVCRICSTPLIRKAPTPGSSL